MNWVGLGYYYACGWAHAGSALGYRPFFDPLPLDDYWLLLALPMVVAISVVYKAIKLDDLSRLPKQAAMLFAQIVFFLVLAASGLWLMTSLV